MSVTVVVWNSMRGSILIGLRRKTTKELAANHPARIHPERFISYDNQLIFNPGLKENRDYICTVVKDIVSRYDIDGLHIDAIFTPTQTVRASTTRLLSANTAMVLRI